MFSISRSATQPQKDTTSSLAAKCHWHPPAGCISQTRIVVHENGTFYFQVLLRSKEAGTMETVDHFLSLCEMMANVKGE